MSSALMWRPVVPIEGYRLPNELKYTISRKLWDTDGSMGGGEVILTASDLPYIEGLRDAGTKGADELIEAIKKHGAVILWHEH